MSLYQWLCLIGIQGAVTTVIAFVITRKLNKAEGKAETARQETAAIAAGMKALLRDRLLQGYKHYINEVKWADEDDRSNLENIYRQYHALGGNGDMKDLRRTFRHLPMVEGGPQTEVSSDE